MQAPVNFDEAVNYIMEIPKFTEKHTMEETVAFLDLLGSPDRKMRIIHVAGTNGKGSVCTFLEKILQRAGYSTALFTSPHLTDIRERITLNGEMIDKESFYGCFMKVYLLMDKAGYHPSFFEFLFFMAMVFYGENPTDYVILETGLGGRLDATNAVRNKVVSVITSISFDHTEYLGDTLEKIASEKAGIIAANTPVVFWETSKAVTDVITAFASRLSAPFVGVSKKDFSIEEINKKSIDFSLHNRYYGNVRATVNSIACYQPMNAACAVSALEFTDYKNLINASAIREGIADFYWVGRMQEVLENVYVDGAHNPDGVSQFLGSVSNDGYKGKRFLLFGVMADKEYPNMLKEIVDSRLFDNIAFTGVDTNRGLNAEGARECFLKLTQQCDYAPKCEGVYENVRDAFLSSITKANHYRVYVVGSLYLVGEILAICRDL